MNLRMLLVGVLVSPISVIAVQRPSDQQVPVPPTFKTEVRARVIDVTVRDKKGNPVTGLSRADFRLQEDGVDQEILDVAAITPNSRMQRATPNGVLPMPRAEQPVNSAHNEGAAQMTSITAIMFERLTPESRELAKIAALKMLEGEADSGELVGVFLIDLSLRPLQNFTTNLPSVRKAVTAAASLATSYYDSNRNGLALPTPLSTDIAEITADEFAGLTRIQGGYATLDALEAVTIGLSRVPGRRSIIFFSDGLPLQTDAVRVRFEKVIAAANRYNVSIYPIDTHRAAGS